MKKLIMITLALALMGCDEQKKPVKARPTWTSSTRKVVVKKAGMEGVTKIVKATKKINAKIYKPGQRMGSWFSRQDVFLKGMTQTRVEFTALVQTHESNWGADAARASASATSFEFYFTANDTSKPFKIKNFTAQVKDNKLYIKPTERGDFEDGFSLISKMQSEQEEQ